MAFSYGFYNSMDGDRKYNAEQVSALFDGLITDGIFATIGDAMKTVVGSGMSVIVKPGRAWFNHTWSLNDSNYTITLDPADNYLSRIDAIVLEVDQSVAVRANAIKVIKGALAGSPTRPTLTNNETLHQYPLAYVKVNVGATAITSADISIMVGQTPTPFVTGVVEGIDIDELFLKWEGEFDIWMIKTEEQFQAWWENIKATLNDNVVTNLQNQIDNRVKYSDKATDEDISNLTPNKWLDSAGAKKFLDEHGVTFNSLDGGGVRLEEIYKEIEFNGFTITNEDELYRLPHKKRKVSSSSCYWAFNKLIGSPHKLNNVIYDMKNKKAYTFAVALSFAQSSDNDFMSGGTSGSFGYYCGITVISGDINTETNEITFDVKNVKSYYTDINASGNTTHKVSTTNGYITDLLTGSWSNTETPGVKIGKNGLGSGTGTTFFASNNTNPTVNVQGLFNEAKILNVSTRNYKDEILQLATSSSPRTDLGYGSASGCVTFAADNTIVIELGTSLRFYYDLDENTVKGCSLSSYAFSPYTYGIQSTSTGGTVITDELILVFGSSSYLDYTTNGNTYQSGTPYAIKVSDMLSKSNWISTYTSLKIPTTGYYHHYIWVNNAGILYMFSSTVSSPTITDVRLFRSYDCSVDNGIVKEIPEFNIDFTKLLPDGASASEYSVRFNIITVVDNSVYYLVTFSNSSSDNIRKSRYLYFKKVVKIDFSNINPISNIQDITNMAKPESLYLDTQKYDNFYSSNPSSKISYLFTSEDYVYLMFTYSVVDTNRLLRFKHTDSNPEIEEVPFEFVLPDGVNIPINRYTYTGNSIGNVVVYEQGQIPQRDYFTYRKPYANKKGLYVFGDAKISEYWTGQPLVFDENELNIYIPYSSTDRLVSNTETTSTYTLWHNTFIIPYGTDPTMNNLYLKNGIIPLSIDKNTLNASVLTTDCRYFATGIKKGVKIVKED